MPVQQRLPAGWPPKGTLPDAFLQPRTGAETTPDSAAAAEAAPSRQPEWAPVSTPMRLLDSPMEGTVLMGSPPKVRAVRLAVALNAQGPDLLVCP